MTATIIWMLSSPWLGINITNFSRFEIWISPSGKSISASTHAHIWIHRICAYVHAYMDFSDGEIRIFGASLHFSIGEIQAGAKNNDFSTGEIHIWIHICTYLDSKQGKPKYVHKCMHVWISPMGKCIFLAPAWISPMGKSKLAQKYWFIYQKNPYVHAYMHIFG